MSLKPDGEDLRTIRKIAILAEMHNFILEAWMPLIEEVKSETLREFLYAARAYAEYLQAIGADGELPREAYLHALDNVKKYCSEAIETLQPIIDVVEELRSKVSKK